MSFFAHDQTLSDSATMISDDGITFRRVASLEEYQECVAIQEEIWGPGFRELVPSAMLMVAQKMAGVCAAAFDADGRMLGFVFGITGFRDGALSHWSDLLAVRRDARGAHVGERLKRYQRELCLAIGVTTMYWTFDPLVARNAHLNLMRLGARASEYVVNMYGSNTGSPLHGTLETDRWIAAWDLTHPGAVPRDPAAEAQFIVHPSADGRTPRSAAYTDAPAVRVAIPPDHEVLSLECRVAWRLASRDALQHYLARGYEVTRFQRAAEQQPPYYELTRA
jgi:predicted GNAT superfamily acetyltransferase